MKIAYFRALRRRRNRSRTGRAEHYAKHPVLGPSEEMFKGILPRLGLLVVFVVATALLFPPAQPTRDVSFKAGDIADRAIIAPFDFEVPLSPEELEVRRADALLRVPPVYVHDRAIEMGLREDLSELFDSLETIADAETPGDRAKAQMVQIQLPYLSPNLAGRLLDPRVLRAVRGAALDYQKRVFSRGLVDNSGPLRARAYTEIAVVDGSQERKLPVDNVIDQGSIDRAIREEAIRRFGNKEEIAQLFIEILRVHLRPNLAFDNDETHLRRQLAIGQVEKTTRISKNQRIIGKHDKVSAEQMQVLAALENARRAASGETSRATLLALYAGEVLKLLLFGLLVGGYMFAHRAQIYKDMLKFGALVAVFGIYLVASSIVYRLGLNPYLMPVALVPVMATSLFDYRLGLAATVFACILMSLVTNVSSGVIFVSLLAGAAAIMGLLRMRSRSHFYTLFLMIFAAYVVGIVAVELGRQAKFSGISTAVAWAMANALFCSLAAMFLLPIFEAAFHIATRFTLLELTDLNKPILKRLNLEAPGTYHHGMQLGNMVDTVSTEIGAEPLKARVMAYYHDIGKIFKPDYYSENQEAGFNKHEKITPQMSRTILLSHVKDGVELARQERLPDLIIDAIQQHHGTTVMAYFYQKALETDSHSSVNKDDFRYPGPKPSSKEAAILMLADAVEPACRSLKDPTPTNIRNMVVKLINSRIQEGQLDESGLTLNDLAAIKERFVTILTSMYHKRVAYPGQEEGTGEVVAKPA